MKRILITLVAVTAVLCAVAVTSKDTTATPRRITNTNNYIGVVADTASVQASPGGSTYYATDTLMFYVSNGVSWVVKSGSLGSTVVNVSAGGFVLSDSLTTDYGIEEKGTAWLDSTMVKTGAISAGNLRAISVDSAKVRTGGISADNLRADVVDSTKVRAGSIAGSDLINPLRYAGTATIAGTLTPQALNTPTQAILADSTLTAARSGYTYIARPIAAKTTATLPAAAAGVNFSFMVADTDTLRVKCAGSDSLITSNGTAWVTTTSVAGSFKVVGTAGKWWIFPNAGTWTNY